MIETLVLEYIQAEQDSSGVPVAVVSYDSHAKSPPFLECNLSVSGDGIPANLASSRDVEYLDALLQDIREASASQDAARAMVSRLKSICFGPIRGRVLPTPPE
jgi:hypothetical protein